MSGVGGEAEEVISSLTGKVVDILTDMGYVLLDDIELDIDASILEKEDGMVIIEESLLDKILSHVRETKTPILFTVNAIISSKVDRPTRSELVQDIYDQDQW